MLGSENFHEHWPVIMLICASNSGVNATFAVSPQAAALPHEKTKTKSLTSIAKASAEAFTPANRGSPNLTSCGVSLSQLPSGFLLEQKDASFFGKS